ncbi:MAG: GNAT family N-acetyltransferase [Betaproteobacteria bacterium]|nr:GNAT family N-acetyltransferase [Betaproteobacteria bacterium]
MAKTFRAVSLEERHFGAWKKLYGDYARFYKTELSETGAHTVWAWICAEKLRGIGGEDKDGALCGIAHWALMLRPLHARPMAYLHDLYVPPEARGLGAGGKLIRAAGAAAKAEGCATLRWATAADNKTAMRLYDGIAEKTPWIIYDRNLA